MSRQESPQKRFYHRLEEYFKGWSDDDVIRELNLQESLRKWADKNLGTISNSNSVYGHHPTVYHYLQTHRPGIFERMEHEANLIADDWPRNHADLEALFSRSDWWSLAVKRRFRTIVRARMILSGPQEWWEAIAPHAEPLIDLLLANGLSAYKIEPVIWRDLQMPSRIAQKLPNGRTLLIHHALKKLIRKVIADRRKAYLAAQAQATRTTQKAPTRRTRKAS